MLLSTKEVNKEKKLKKQREKVNKDQGRKCFKDFISLFLEQGKGRETERERNINVWLFLTHLQLGTWLTTLACALTRNQTSNLLAHRQHSIH